MKSEQGKLEVTYTSRGLRRYQLEIRHQGLGKFQIIRGDNHYIVEQKARATRVQWDQMWDKKQQIEEKKNLASEQSAEAQVALAALEATLAHTLNLNDAVDWKSLKNHSDYPVPKPKKLKLPNKPTSPEVPREPRQSDNKYQAKLGLLDRLVSSRRIIKEQQVEERFRTDHQRWYEAKEEAANQYNSLLEQYDKRVKELEAEYKVSVATWEKERVEYLQARDATNTAIDEKKEKYLKGEQEAILDYCHIVLSHSQYPDYFPQSYQLDYNPTNKLLLVDYQLPLIKDIPTLREVKYTPSRDEFTEKHIPQSQLDKLYDNLLYQITLRTIHELFEADRVDALSCIVFNGYINSVDLATGQEMTACILSLQTNKEEFKQINLGNIDPKACFKKLKGVSSSKLHSLAPVAPILKIERTDHRFVTSYAVADAIQDSDNLAAMDWEDFEHLIRELFEREFLTSGGEVRVTRVSRDGGVDAVVFDPDPLRGGKIVIQAKRYTNPVGVSAIRDLFGTVMNEGANKGILVTTSDYGPDAYEFARGKPLVLLNGANLLHLLEKHGHKARIDLQEAKQIITEGRSHG
jgi:restriction system protein